MSNDKKPAIRFKDYSDDWEQRKLGNMMDVTSVKRIHQSDWTDLGVRFLRARDIVAESKNEEVSEPLFISQEKYDEYSAVSGKVEKGDLLVTGVGTIGVPMLINSEEPLYFKDGNIIWFKNKNAIDGRFFYHSFKGLNIQKFIKESAGTGTVGTYTIENGKKTPINLPLQKEEQEKIGEYFSNLDNLIALHQRKYDKLQNLKKAMLEKMFPKNGSNVPEIRFKGFTDAWEQRKFGDYNDLMTGYPFESDKFSEEGIKLVRGMNVKRGYLDFSGDICVKWNSCVGLENFLLKDGDILIQMDGALIGKSYAKIKENQLPALLVQRVTRARTNNKFASQDFMYQTIQRDFLRYIEMNKTETAVPHLSLNDIRNFEIMVPCLAEQKKIGEYFDSLDNLITLHQRELEKLKNIKKAMLEKMFV